jgi:hypothetical protein
VYYTYDHPEGKGFGEHHVEEGHPALDQRSAAWQGVDGHATPHASEMTMADLDMPSGTRVELLEHDKERDLHRVQWVDSHGTERITSIDPDFFVNHFAEVADPE